MSKNFYPNRSYVSGITPPKLLNRKTLSILFMLIAFSPFMAKAQVKKQVMTTVTQNNGTGGVSFNIKAKNSIKITDFLVTINSGSNNWEVWYSTDSVNGAPKISTTTGWTQLETGSVTGNGSTPVSLGMTKTLVMQAGKTYGFYIGQNNMRYHTYTTSDPAVFSDLNVQLNTGPGVGYGGSISPTIATRQLCGGVEYELLNRSKNDIGITDLIEPTTFCSGTQKIKVKVNNFGINQIDSFRIGWEINDTLRKPFVFKSKLDTFGGKGNSSDTVTIGSLSFPSGGVSYDLKVWTYSPNGGKDTINKNDTLIVTLRPSLSGSYTIDPSGTAKNNFKTFADLFKTFESAGVCGPVSVKVSSPSATENNPTMPMMATVSPSSDSSDRMGRLSRFRTARFPMLKR